MAAKTNLKKTVFKSSDAVHEVTSYLWEPVGIPVCGVVQIIHGMREHMGRYSDFAAFLNAKGYAVCGNDHLGHGESVQADGKYGYFGMRDGSRYIVNDCRRMTKIIRKRYPDVPLFLLGHSLGSFIGRVYITRYSDISGFICVGTGGDNPLAPTARTIASGLSYIGFDGKPGNLLDKMAFGNYNARHPYEESKMAWLSRDNETVKAYDNDSHTRSIFTYGGFRDMLDIQMAACGKGWSKRVPKKLPILIISGTEDPVGGYGKGVSRVYEQLKKAGAAEVCCKLYMGARHEVLNELNKEEVYFDVYCWMEENKFH